MTWTTIIHFAIIYPSVFIVPVLVAVLGVCWQLFPENRKQTEWLLVAAIFAEPLDCTSMFVARQLSHLRPMKYDLYVYQIDSILGHPSFFLGQIVNSHAWVKNIVCISYNLLPMSIFTVLAAYSIGKKDEVAQVVKAFAMNFGFAPFLYFAFPACGPGFAFADFPTLPKHVVAHPILLDAPPNAVPSIHFSSALLFAWFLRRWTWGKIVGPIFILTTALATLGSGQHYGFDLICSIPYVILLLNLSKREFIFPSKAEPAKVEITTYSFCESTFAGPNSPWHIRPLTMKGRKLGGCADTDSLCGRAMAWDLRTLIDNHHLTHACKSCVMEYNGRAETNN